MLKISPSSSSSRCQIASDSNWVRWCVQMPTLLTLCPVSARPPRSSMIICDTWTIAVNPRTETRTLGPRGFYFASSAAWNALSDRPWSFVEQFKKLNWKITFFLDIPIWVTLILLYLFVVRANVIVYKLARANICFELNWIELNWIELNWIE